MLREKRQILQWPQLTIDQIFFMDAVACDSCGLLSGKAGGWKEPLDASRSSVYSR
jgi:hypothetical protein